MFHSVTWCPRLLWGSLSPSLKRGYERLSRLDVLMVKRNRVRRVAGGGRASAGGFRCRGFLTRGPWPREGDAAPEPTQDVLLKTTPLGFLPQSPCALQGLLGGSEGPGMQSYEVLKISQGEIVRNFYQILQGAMISRS